MTERAWWAPNDGGERSRRPLVDGAENYEHPTMLIDWWGHSTCTITFDGLRILTDPVLTKRVVHLSRNGSPVPARRAAEADVVLLSHLHADHLHLPSLRMIAEDTPLIGPRGSAALLRRRARRIAARVVELGPAESTQVGSVTVTATAANHDGQRHRASSHAGPALGFLISDGRSRVWFAGDTGLFEGMSTLGPVDVAVLPVGGWGPTLGPQHLDPAQAAESARRVGARDALPMHYGTLWPIGLKLVAPRMFRRLCLQPGEQFAAALAELSPSTRAHVLLPGGSAEIALARPDSRSVDQGSADQDSADQDGADQDSADQDSADPDSAAPA